MPCTVTNSLNCGAGAFARVRDADKETKTAIAGRRRTAAHAGGKRAHLEEVGRGAGEGEAPRDRRGIHR